MGRVKTEFTSDPTQVVKALERMQRETIKLREDNARLRDEYRNGKQTLGGMFGEGIAGAAKFTAGLASVHTAVSAIRAEYDNLIQRQGKAAGVQVPLAAVQTQAFQNLGGDPEITSPEELVALVNQVIDETHALPRVAWQAMSDALSARGDKSARDAADAVTAAIRLSPGTPEQLPILAGAALDVGKAAGVDSEQALGFMLGIGSKSRVTNLEALASNIAPGALDVMKFGDDMGSAGALVATISQGVNDTQGAVSRTTAVSLAQQLERFFQKTLGRDDLTSTEQRIGAIQADPELRRLFMEGGTFQRGDESVSVTPASFERKTFATVRELLTGDEQSSVVRQYRAADAELAAIDPGDKFRSTIEQIANLPAVQTAAAQRAFASATESIQAADRGAMSAVIRDGLADLRESMGSSPAIETIQSAVTDFRTGGTPDLEAALMAVRALRDQGPSPGLMQSIGDTASASLDFVNPFVSDDEMEQNAANRRRARQTDSERRTLDALEIALSKLAETQRLQLEETRRIRQAQESLRNEQRRGAQNKGAAGALAIANAGAK